LLDVSYVQVYDEDVDSLENCSVIMEYIEILSLSYVYSENVWQG